METLVDVLMTVTVALLTLLVLLLAGAVWRMLRGPGVATRFVALDMLTGLGVALLATTATLLDRRELLDVALGVAAFSFIGTVAVGVFLQRHEGSKE